MRPPALALLALGLAAATPPSALGAPPAAPGAPPRFSQIQRGAPPAPPALPSAPPSLPPGQRPAWLAVQGFGPQPPPAPQPEARGARPRPGAPVYHESHLRLAAPGGCLRRAHEGTEPQAVDTLVLEAHEGVVPVQADRLIVADGAAQLEVRQAWFDARSQGAREIASARMPLTRLLPTRHGLDLWGVVADDRLHVVVAPAPPGGEPRPGALVPEPCSLVRLVVTNAPGGQQVEASFARAYLTKMPNAPDLIGVQHSLRAMVSLSRTSRDPEPVVAVGLRHLGASLPRASIVD